MKFNYILQKVLETPVAIGWCFFQKLRQATLWDYYLFNGYSLYPSIITVYPTMQCNLHCKTCKIKNRLATSSVELSIETLNNLIKEVSFFKPLIYFSGGEPLLVKNICLMIKAVKDKKMLCGLVTNGTIIDKEYAEKIIDSGLDVISVSIDGYEESNDIIRGKNSFKKALAGVHSLVNAKKNFGSNIQVNVSCLINAKNLNSLNKFVECLENIGVDTVLLWHPDFKEERIVELHNNIFRRNFEKECNVSGYICKGKREDDEFLDMDLDSVFNIIGDIKNRATKIKINCNPNFSLEKLKEYYSISQPAKYSKCVNAWFVAVLFPNGDISPCMNYTVGNVNEKKFLKIWNGKEFKRFRKIIKKHRYLPGCLRCCGMSSL